MIKELLLLVLGLVLILFGANYLTDGSANLARRFKISEMIVGLTVIAIGTSTPELVVSALSAGQGSGDMAIGNVAGSNIFNILVILGITSLVTNVKLSRDTMKRDMSIMLAATSMMIFFAYFNSIFGLGENRISRLGGAVLLICFVTFIIITVRQALKGRESAVNRPITSDSPRTKKMRERNLAIMLLMIAGGLAALVFGGELFLDNAKALAHRAHISESVIAITLMAAGTSLPELAASVAAARKGKAQMALGNVIGSNIANIFLVLGTSALIRPLGLGNISAVDLGMVAFSALLLLASAYTFKKFKIDKIEGIVFIVLYIAYTVYILSVQ